MSIRRILFGMATIFAMFLMTACDDDNSKTNNYTSSGPALEIKTPSVSITGVLQNKNGDPIANHKVFLGDQVDLTNEAGVFTFNNVRVMSGVDVNTSIDTVGQGRRVHIVVPSVKDIDGSVLNLGATATVDVDKYLTGIYESADQTYFISLDGHTIYAGAIQLPQLGATVTARLEDNVTQASIGGSVYLTVNNEDINGTSGVEFGNTDLTYTAVSYVERSYMADANSTTGMFTVSGLPYKTAMNVLVSGYAENTGAFVTYDNNRTQEVGDVPLGAIYSGDTGALEFESIVGAVGDNNYTITMNDLVGNGTSLTGAITNFIAPSTTLTLKFREAMDTSKIDTSSIKYVRTLSTDQLSTISDINTLFETNSSNQVTLLGKLDSYLDKSLILQTYLEQHGFNPAGGNTDINATSDTTFGTYYSDYKTALNTLLSDANTTSGGDTLSGYTYFQENNGSELVNFITTGTDMFADFGLISQSETATGIALTDRLTYLSTLQGADSYNDMNVSTVTTSGTDTVVITLTAALPSNNVAQIGLVTFDFVDTAGNLLTTSRTGGVDLVTDHSTSYVTQVSVGTAE